IACGNLRCVRLISIDVHLQREAVVHADLHMIEDRAALVVSLNGNNISVLHACSLSILGGHMDVTHCHDTSLFQIKGSFRSHDSDGRLPLISPDSRTGTFIPSLMASVADTSTWEALRTGPRI